LATSNAAGILVDAMYDWGIDTVFGLPGDGINGIMEALRQRRDKIRFIHVCHEEAAAFMACGYAKFTGRIGCCLATSGPGGLHLLNGLYDAKLDGQPVLAITGLQYHDLLGTMTQQDVALDRVFADVAVFSERIMGAAHVQNMVDLACRSALSRRGVAHLTIPVDLQEQSWKSDTRSHRNQPDHTSDVYARGARVPRESDLHKAAEILNAGKKVVILAGQGALNAGDELETTAEVLGAPIIKALLGKACVADDSPYTTGGIGLLGTEPSVEAMQACDTLLIVGSSFPYIEFYPKPGAARCVQIELDAARVGLRYPAEVGLVGDSRHTLNALLPLLEKNRDRSFLKKAQKGMEEWREKLAVGASSDDKPMQPQRVLHELGKRLPSNAIVACDTGTITTWWARHISAKRGQMHSCSGNLASMACGLPYAIAAQVAHPDRTVVAITGDGALLMCMAELATCVKYKLPIKIVVLKNNTLGMIKWEQMVFMGNPEYGCDLQPVDFAMVARACGVKALTIEDPAQCGSIFDEALAADGPVLIEASIDPHTPPMPPKVTAKQALHFAESLAKGTPEGGEVLKKLLGTNIREMV
jgi:pyruvate dehydrogenase (quinone)